jgi:hypothetical protein
MANTFRIKRRLAAGGTGAPSTLKNAEVAFNESSKILYYGLGDDGAGNAQSVLAIGGEGIIVLLTTNQTIAGTKTFSASPICPTPTPGDNSTKAATTAFVTAAIASLTIGTGDMTRAVYDTNLDGKVNSADVADAVSSLATGTTQTSTDNSTKLATTAFVKTAISNLVNGASTVLDTLAEIATALGNDPNFATTITTALSGKADLVLSNLSNFATARTNLGLGTIATQNASAVAITGGTIDGISIDGGTF